MREQVANRMQSGVETTLGEWAKKAHSVNSLTGNGRKPNAVSVSGDGAELR